MNYEQRNKICRRRDNENWNVAAGPLEYLANQPSDHHPTDRAGHAANAYDRSDCISREHV